MRDEIDDIRVVIGSSAMVLVIEDRFSDQRVREYKPPVSRLRRADGDVNVGVGQGVRRGVATHVVAVHRTEIRELKQALTEAASPTVPKDPTADRTMDAGVLVQVKHKRRKQQRGTGKNI